MNRYRVILRDGTEFFVESARFQIDDGFLVLSRDGEDVAAFTESQLGCVMLAEVVKTDAKRPVNIHQDKFSAARIA